MVNKSANFAPIYHDFSGISDTLTETLNGISIAEIDAVRRDSSYSMHALAISLIMYYSRHEFFHWNIFIQPTNLPPEIPTDPPDPDTMTVYSSWNL